MSDIFYNDLQKDITQLTFMDIYNRLSLLAKSVFEWHGLPEGMNEKFIERYLFEDGRCMFFHDKTLGWMITRCTDSATLNPYDEPTRLYPAAVNYTPEETGEGAEGERGFEVGKECVLIQNNDDAIPTTQTIRLFAARMALMQRTIDVNIKAQKTPYIIRCGSKQQLLSLRNMFKDIEGFEDCIVVDKSLEVEDAIKVFSTAAPVVFDKLAIEKNKLWNECMTFLGVNNANMDKRERLVDDEVQANNEQIMLSAEMMLKARESAAEAMSKLSGRNISVKLRQLQKPTADSTAPGKEGAEE